MSSVSHPIIDNSLADSPEGGTINSIHSEIPLTHASSDINFPITEINEMISSKILQTKINILSDIDSAIVEVGPVVNSDKSKCFNLFHGSRHDISCNAIVSHSVDPLVTREFSMNHRIKKNIAAHRSYENQICCSDKIRNLDSLLPGMIICKHSVHIIPKLTSNNVHSVNPFPVVRLSVADAPKDENIYSSNICHPQPQISQDIRKQSDAQFECTSRSAQVFSFGKLQLHKSDMETLCPEPVSHLVNDDIQESSVGDCVAKPSKIKMVRCHSKRICNTLSDYASNFSIDPHNQSVRISPEARCSAVGQSKWVRLKVNEQISSFLLDTGSQITILKFAESSPKCFPDSLNVKGATGHKLNILGKASVNFDMGTHTISQEIYISDSVQHNILGMDFLHSQGCLVDLTGNTMYIQNTAYPLLSSAEIAAYHYHNSKTSHFVSQNYIALSNSDLPHVIQAQLDSVPPMYRRKATDLLLKYFFLFDESKLGCAANFNHNIELSDKRAVKQMPRRVSIAQKEIIAAELKEMLERGVIEASYSPWASPVVLVKKKDGGIRFCIDYRRLNTQTIVDAFPLPNPQDIIDSLAGATHFATLDLKSGFWQIPVRESDKEKTAFCTPSGHYQFKRMPFGLVNATATFQRVMQRVLSGLVGHGVQVFVDDIVVYATSFENLLQLLDKVFHQTAQAGMTFNTKKCHLFQTDINLLGHHISANGVSPNNDKKLSILTWPEPTNRKQVRSFLGTAGYYRRFIKDFAALSTPLSRLTSIKNSWKWGSEETASFRSLQRALTETPLLHHFIPGRPIIIDTDASAFAIGAVLSQTDPDGHENPIAYYSRCLSAPEINYCVTRRELLAVIDSLRHWRHYVSGTLVKVRSDHASLSWLKGFKQPEGQLARWLEKLSEFHVDLVYRKGTASMNADGLSRRPCAGDCPHCFRRETRETEAKVSVVIPDQEWNWSVEQMKDNELMKAKRWIETGQKPEWEEVSGESAILKSFWSQLDMLALKNNILIRKFHLPFGIIRDQIIIPVHLRVEIVKQAHLQGHFGTLRTQQLVADRYFWPGWKSDVLRTVQTCVPCNQRKGPQSRTRLALKRYQASEPMQRIAVDVLGPLPTTARGHKYVVVISDYFTKWVEAIPTVCQEATVIADILIDAVISRFGVPLEIHSDQGRNFESNLVSLICKRLNIVKTRTTPYRPQSDGQVERFNRTLLDALAKASDKQADWDLLVPLICLYYRATVHASTGVTPAMLMLGREIRLPIDIVFPPSSEPLADSYPQYVINLEQRLLLASQYARNHLRLSWEAMSTAHQVSKRVVPIDVTRQVFVFNPSLPKGVSPKLARLWRGPYTVVEEISPYLFRIAVGGRRGVQVLHRSHIYQPPSQTA